MRGRPSRISLRSSGLHADISRVQSRITTPDGRRLVVPAVHLAVVIVAWGANYVLMKLVLPGIGPMQFVSIRMVGTVILIASFLGLTGRDFLPVRPERALLALIGLLQVAGTLGFSILALAVISAGRAAVLMYTMPLWAMPLEYWLLGQTVTVRQISGAVISLAGLALFFDPRIVDWHDPAVIAGHGSMLAAAICWALGAALYRRRDWRTDFWTQTFWQVVVSVPPLVIAAVVSWNRPVVFSMGLLAVMAYNWLIATALAYWCWSKLLTEMSAAVAGQLLMLTPLVGYFSSSFVFADPISAGVLVSLALILGGLTLTVRARSGSTDPWAEPIE
jgi:drug/metabolite transporter (DMT)-like permease